MSYRNANEVLPDALLREVQKYAGGEALYIPRKPGARREWGEGTGAKLHYKERNGEIREKHARGAAVEALADEYGLSAESIRKIVYG
jgi:Mor family transcriptional regulator